MQIVHMNWMQVWIRFERGNFRDIQIFARATVFNIDNNQKCFLSSESAYYYDFWRSCDTKDWSNDAENTAFITEINYILKYTF